MTLHSGERQVATTVEGIRKDHFERYLWAASRMKDCIILDLGCGVGYGSRLLTDAGNYVVGIDNDVETLDFANQHFLTEKCRFTQCDLNVGFNAPDHDTVVAFEVLEHLMDPREMLKALSLTTGMLFASVPNEDGFKFTGQKFHQRHYTKAEFETLLNESGWHVTEWWGQTGIDSVVELNPPNSRTLIAVAVPIHFNLHVRQ